MAHDYYDESYQTFEDLQRRAAGLGAVEISIECGAWTDSPRGPVYAATAVVRTADGRLARRVGRAAAGDARTPDALPADRDTDCEDRAERRALRLAIRTAYPDAPEGDEPAQPPHVRRAQALVRRAAERLGLTRDELAAVAHRRYGVEHLSELSPEQVDAVEDWLGPYVTAE